MPAYLLIAPVNPAGDVDFAKALKGNVTVGGHMYWIKVTSFLFKNQGPDTMSRHMSIGPGDVTISRDSIDGISPLLLRWSGTGKAPLRGQVMAIIRVVNASEDTSKLATGNQVYQEFKLSDVVLTAYGTGDNGRTESFTLSYGNIANSENQGVPTDRTDPYAYNASRGM